MMQFKSLCVYCGSNPGNEPAFMACATAVGTYLAEHKIRLVYGGGKSGLMGAVADATLAHGGEVIGIIPDFLKAREVAHPNLTELFIVRSMHERKLLLNSLSAGFVTLPGGIGTLEELAEIWSWTHLNLQNKPLGLLNVEGYYDHLLNWFDVAVKTGFMPTASRLMLTTADSITRLIELMQRSLTPPDQTRSVDPSRF